MFSLDREMRYWLYNEPTDMRKSFHTLSGVVRNHIGGDPMSGEVYIFMNKRRNRIKLLHYETGGLVIYSKMLDRGTFGIPLPRKKDSVTCSISWDNLRELAEGIMANPDSRQARLEGLKDKVASLEESLYWLRKKMFGKMSEKNLPLDPTVLQEPGLFDEVLTEEEQAALEAELKKGEEEESNLIKVKSFERKPHKAIDTSKLEIREEHIYPEVGNRDDYTELDPEVTDSLVIVPAQIYVRRIIRHKLVLKSNLQIKDPDRKAFELAPLPTMPLPKCMASESLLADIVLQKFMYHMPFYRVIQKYKELGVTISDSTMNDWYAAACEKLKLLYDILKREVLSRDYIQVDESTLPVIDNEKHRAVKGYMWCTRAVEIATMRMTSSRAIHISRSSAAGLM